MLISGKSHSWVESRNFWVSVETLDFARVCTFTGVIAVGSPAEARRGGGRLPAGPRRCSGRCEVLVDRSTQLVLACLKRRKMAGGWPIILWMAGLGIYVCYTCVSHARLARLFDQLLCCVL